MTTEEKTEPPSRSSSSTINAPANDSPGTDGAGLMGWVKRQILRQNRQSNAHSLREAIEEYIEESTDEKESSDISVQERTLLTNVLELRDLTVDDVMIPRTDIAAIPVDISQSDLLSMLAEKQFSRLPVYGESLDDILGTIHIKDILACLAQGKDINVTELIRDVPIVSPSMHVFDLLLMMKQMRKHMVLVVDEFGGIDGLATIGDVMEATFGDIDDEHDDESAEPQMVVLEDSAVMVDARIDLEDFQAHFNAPLSETELEDNDTIGGLVFSLAGYAPSVGEIIEHTSGMTFEVTEADQRRVSRVLIRNIPGLSSSAE